MARRSLPPELVILSCFTLLAGSGGSLLSQNAQAEGRSLPDQLREALNEAGQCIQFYKGQRPSPADANCTRLVPVSTSEALIPRSGVVALNYIGAFQQPIARKNARLTQNHQNRSAIVRTLQSQSSFQHASKPESWLESIVVDDSVKSPKLLTLEGKFTLVIPSGCENEASEHQAVSCVRTHLSKGMNLYSQLKKKQSECEGNSASKSAECKTLLSAVTQLDDLNQSIQIVGGKTAESCPSLKPLERFKGIVTLKGTGKNQSRSVSLDPDFDEQRLEMARLGISENSPLNPENEWNHGLKEQAQTHCEKLVADRDRNAGVNVLSPKEAAQIDEDYEAAIADVTVDECVLDWKESLIETSLSRFDTLEELPSEVRDRLNLETCELSSPMNYEEPESTPFNGMLRGLAFACAHARIGMEMTSGQLTGCKRLNAELYSIGSCDKERGSALSIDFHFENGKFVTPAQPPLSEAQAEEQDFAEDSGEEDMGWDPDAPDEESSED